MAWIAVDEDEQGYVYDKKPTRYNDEWCNMKSEITAISDYAIQLIVGRDLTWEDEPVEVKAV